jgi:hypothetical protein
MGRGKLHIGPRERTNSAQKQVQENGVRSVSVLERLLKAQLGEYIRVHPDTRELSLTRVVDSHGRGKSIAKGAGVFLIEDKLPIYVAMCGSLARKGIRDLNQAGMILLVRSSSGLAFHVELGGVGTQMAVTRVSTGKIAKDLENSMQKTGKQSARRSKGSELRVFRIAAMHVSAVWLHHSKKRGADVFVPYTPNFAGLRLRQSYKLHRIEKLLKKHATSMILRWYDRYEKNLTQPKSQTRPSS